MSGDRAIATLATFCEASNASQEEREAIVHTMFNRVKLGRWKKTVAGCVLQRMQWSEFNDDAIDNRNLERGAETPDSDPVMMECAAAYDAVLNGAPDPTNGATHYHDKSIKPPPWTVGATVALVTDKFVFYSNVP